MQTLNKSRLIYEFLFHLGTFRIRQMRRGFERGPKPHWFSRIFFRHLTVLGGTLRPPRFRICAILGNWTFKKKQPPTSLLHFDIRVHLHHFWSNIRPELENIWHSDPNLVRSVLDDLLSHRVRTLPHRACPRDGLVSVGWITKEVELMKSISNINHQLPWTIFKTCGRSYRGAQWKIWRVCCKLFDEICRA